MNQPPRFLITPGHVRSSRDGQRHYIDAYELMQLYGLDSAQCIVFDPRQHRLTDPVIKTMVWLGPRVGGDYRSYLAYVTDQRQDKITTPANNQSLQSIAQPEGDSMRNIQSVGLVQVFTPALKAVDDYMHVRKLRRQRKQLERDMQLTEREITEKRNSLRWMQQLHLTVTAQLRDAGDDV